MEKSMDVQLVLISLFISMLSGGKKEITEEEITEKLKKIHFLISEVPEAIHSRLIEIFYAA